MAIAQLTHLYISIPESGAPLGQVPEQCFPRVKSSSELTDPHRVSFTSGVTILGGEQPLDVSPDILIHDPVCPEITVEDEMDIVSVETDGPITVVRPPPGFWQFSWPPGGVGPDGDLSLFNFSNELPGWFPRECGDQSVDPPSLPISPILQDSLDDSVVAYVGSSREELSTPSEAVVATQTSGNALPVGMDFDALADSSSPDVNRPFSGSPVGTIADLPNLLDWSCGRHSPGFVPRWRLAREGPFLAERSSSSLRCFGAGCAFRNTTYRPSDYESPSGEFGFPLHHPRFLEWIGVPEAAGLLEMGPGRWLHSLTRDQAMDVAIQLHRDVCLMRRIWTV